jgi:tRNA nucleotidyltransferase/poly(A) polymerase
VRALAERLRFSTLEARRLEAWARQSAIAATTTESVLARTLYEGDRAAIGDQLRLALAIARGKAVSDDKAMIEAGGISRLLAFAEKWKKPEFPLKGGDLKRLGLSAGPKLGAALKSLEAEWIASGFTLDRDALLARAAAAAKS